MEDEQFWLAIWRLVAAAFCVLVVSVAGCTVATNKMIASSPDPLSAACAMGATRQSCIVAGRNK